MSNCNRYTERTLTASSDLGLVIMETNCPLEKTSTSQYILLLQIYDIILLMGPVNNPGI